MSKVEEFIEQRTKTGSNILIKGDNKSYTDIPVKYDCSAWLTPDEAREIVKIAREEAIKEACDWLSYHLDTSKIEVNYKFNIIEDLRKALKQ